MNAANEAMLQPEDHHPTFVDVVVLRTEALADCPQGDAVRHRGIELEDALHAGQRLVRPKGDILTARSAQRYALDEVLQILCHVDVAVLKDRQQLNDAVVDQVLYA